MHPDWKQQFDRDGFVVIRDFLNGEDLREMEEGMARFLRGVAPTMGRGHVMYENPGDPASLKQADCMHLERGLNEIRLRGKVRELAEFLIGPVSPQQAEFFDKPPHKNKPTPPHQDGFYFCIRPNVACTVWVPLDAAGEDNGALSYIRGSHRLGVLPHNASSVLGFSQGLAGDPDNFGERVLCPAKPGDVLVHHSLTIHMAGGNPSVRHRRTLGFVYYSAAAELDQEAYDRYQSSLKAQREARGIEHTASIPR